MIETPLPAPTYYVDENSSVEAPCDDPPKQALSQVQEEAAGLALPEETTDEASSQDGLNKIILGPVDYLLSSPGKSLRAQLVAAFNEWLKVPKEKLAVINRIIDLLHTGSLLIDDIQDSSTLRRGQPVAHSIFGIAQTINSANYAYFAAQEQLEELANPAAARIFVNELLNLHRGQGMDLYWRDALICPSEDEYLDMVCMKTGGLFRLAVRLMQLESKQERDFVSLVDLLGITFQIRDDYKNLWSEVYTDNKGFCEDLTEGKFSFPIIHSIRSDPDNRQLLNILRQKSADESVKLFARKYMESTGSTRYCRQRISALMKRARGMVEQLNGELGSSERMGTILDFLEFE